MRGLFIGLLIVGGIFWVGKTFLKDKGDFSIDRLISGSPEETAERRVEQILEGLKKEGDGNGLALQASICQWDSAMIAIQDKDEFEQAYDGFDRWRDAGGINHRKITSYTVTGSELVQEEPPVVNVSGTIEGRPFEMRVPHKRPISWVR